MTAAVPLPVSALVLNQTNALNLTPYCQERKLLQQTTLWHKIIIHNVCNVDREIVLRGLLNSVHPHDLIPVNYTVEGENAHFIARNCSLAIEKLCRDNLVIHNRGDQMFILTIILGFSNTTETQLNVQRNIYDTIKKRYDIKTGTLDLDSFHRDQALSELIFCVLSQPKILHFVLQLAKQFLLKSVRLSNNELRTVNPLEVLWSSKTLQTLDLRFNLIENMVSLSSLKSMQIKDLMLDGNPVCQNYDETGYVQAIKEICPTIKKLDGILLGSEGFVAFRRNFAVSLEAEPFVDQFIEHYYTLFDSKERRGHLINLYHPEAIFSITSSYVTGQSTSSTLIKLDNYKKISRNLLKISDLSKVTENVIIGNLEIQRIISNMPATEHDPYTFTADVLQFNSNCVTICITGAFREPVQSLRDVECLYSFTRVFVLVSKENNGEYVIINDMMHVANASTNLANRAFKNVRLVRADSMTLRTVDSPQGKSEFMKMIHKVTGLNDEWTKRCLEEANWDLKRAFEIIVDLHKLDKIPIHAFSSCAETPPSFYHQTINVQGEEQRPKEIRRNIKKKPKIIGNNTRLV